MSRSAIHRTIYIVALCLLAGAMTTSVFFANMMWVLLLANWVFEWNWRDKFAAFRSQHLLQAFLVLLAVHVVWLVGTSNWGYALFDLQKKLPLFVIPLVVLTSAPLNRKELIGVGFCYMATVLVVSIIGLVRYLTIPDLPYRNIVPYISHIRFGMNVCMTLVLLAYVAFKCRKTWFYLLGGAVGGWLLVFLLILHAYTAFVILFVLGWVLVMCFGSRLPKTMRRVVTAVFLVVSVASVALVGYYCYDYYHLRPLATQPLAAYTPNGHRYCHLDDGVVENGNYIHTYICETEMRLQWAKMSSVPFDSATAGAWTIYPTLLRYLNGMGVTKDSLGMSHLTPRDVAAIEKGIANPVYLQPGPRKMVYVMCYEYENYRCYRSVSNFTMLQRFELWRNGFRVFAQHPILGVGTGDVVDQCHERLERTHSPLATTQLHTHNQYLNFLVAFGLLGFGIIVWFFVRALRCGKVCRRILFSAFLCILLVSFLSEDTLETLAGITFCALGFSILGHPSKVCEKHLFNK